MKNQPGKKWFLTGERANTSEVTKRDCWAGGKSGVAFSQLGQNQQKAVGNGS